MRQQHQQWPKLGSPVQRPYPLGRSLLQALRMHLPHRALLLLPCQVWRHPVRYGHQGCPFAHQLGQCRLPQYQPPQVQLHLDLARRQVPPRTSKPVQECLKIHLLHRRCPTPHHHLPGRWRRHPRPRHLCPTYQLEQRSASLQRLRSRRLPQHLVHNILQHSFQLLQAPTRRLLGCHPCCPLQQCLQQRPTRCQHLERPARLQRQCARHLQAPTRRLLM